MPWVSYEKLREELNITQVIADYDIELRGSGTQRKCLCPAPCCRDPKERTVSVNVEEGVFKCFKCDARGNLIDFAALVEDLNPHDKQQFREAALRLQRKYQIESKRPERTRTDENGKVHRRAPTPKSADGKRRKKLVNEPLDFELKNLDSQHESVQELGLSAETVEHFGLGYCSRRGMLQNRIAFPLRDRDGRLIGYGGRSTNGDLMDADQPLYIYPDTERTRESDGAVLVFDLSRVLYGAHSLPSEVDELVVVDSPHHVWHLFDAGHEAVVALLGPRPQEQGTALAELMSPSGCIWFVSLMPDILETLMQACRHRFVRWLPADGQKAVRRQVDSINES